MLKKLNKVIVTTAIMATAIMPTQVFAAPGDVSAGSVQVSGSVPEIFSIQARGVPGDLDLSPNVQVNNRLLGIFHLKYNLPLASFSIKSDTASGLPEDSGAVAAPFATAMSYAFDTACTTVDSAFMTSGAGVTAVQMGAGHDIKTTTANFWTTGFTAGLEQDCALSATWVGTATAIPLAGKYMMTITVTMTST
jgi:hypothetical protein